jgi:hypothetical protein
MPHYMISVYLPNDYDPSTETEEQVQKLHALNRELAAKGVKKFACGLSPKTITLRPREGAELLITDGPYIEAKEFIGGLMMLETASYEEALGWVKQFPVARNAVLEMREVFYRPAPEVEPE